MSEGESFNGGRSGKPPDRDELVPLPERKRPTNAPTAATKSLKRHILHHLSTSYPHIPPDPRYQSPLPYGIQKTTLTKCKCFLDTVSLWRKDA